MEIIKERRLDQSGLESRINLALEYGNQGCSCSEAVMAAYLEYLNSDLDQAIRIASGFGGGMGLRGETCGAVNAAVMVLGLAFGTPDLKDGYTRQRTYLVVDEFVSRFIERQGSLNCRELCVGHSMATPQAAKALRASGRPQRIIQETVSILEEIMQEQSGEQ